LAGSLLESLDGTVDPSAEEAWKQEIARRIEELDSGKNQFHGQRRGVRLPPSSMAAKSLDIHPSALAELKSSISWHLEQNEATADKASPLLIRKERD
jgi:type II secretory pathway component PulL